MSISLVDLLICYKLVIIHYNIDVFLDFTIRLIVDGEVVSFGEVVLPRFEIRLGGLLILVA